MVNLEGEEIEGESVRKTESSFTEFYFRFFLTLKKTKVWCKIFGFFIAIIKPKMFYTFTFSVFL